MRPQRTGITYFPASLGEWVSVAFLTQFELSPERRRIAVTFVLGLLLLVGAGLGPAQAFLSPGLAGTVRFAGQLVLLFALSWTAYHLGTSVGQN